MPLAQVAECGDLVRCQPALSGAVETVDTGIGEAVGDRRLAAALGDQLPAPRHDEEVDQQHATDAGVSQRLV
jgi:hypothetical protein